MKIASGGALYRRRTPADNGNGAQFAVLSPNLHFD